MQRLYRSILILLALFLVNGCTEENDHFYPYAVAVPAGGADDGGGGSEDVPVPGTAVIELKGGDSAAGNGGSAQSIQVQSYADVTISKYGRVDAAFDLPDYAVQTDLGTNPCVVSGSVPVELLAVGGDAPSAGSLYMIAGDQNLYLSDGSGTVGSHPAVTGLQVNAGAQLTLPLNWDATEVTHVDGQDMARLSFPYDVVIDGRVSTLNLTTAADPDDERHGGPATARDMGALYIQTTGNFMMGPAAVIDLGGADASAADERGGDGGGLSVYCDGGCFVDGSIDLAGGNGLGSGIGGDAAVMVGPNGLLLNPDGAMVNQAVINAAGGSGAVGGTACRVHFDSFGAIYNTATINAAGGSGTAGRGGHGGDILFYSDIGGIHNSGDLLSTGGNGSVAGYPAGMISMQVMTDGDVLNSGDINTCGGSCTVDGSGSYAQGVAMVARGGDILCSGDLAANGGAAKGSFAGGQGGSLHTQCVPGFPAFGTAGPAAPGRIAFSGNISLNGGSGEPGGEGGVIVVDNTHPLDKVDEPLGPVEFLGYAAIDISGGSGAMDGGQGGFLEVRAQGFESPFGFMTPSIANDVPIYAGGGAGTIDTGGGGGHVTLLTLEPYSDDGARSVINSGDIDVSGGNAGLLGGGGGYIYFQGYDYLKNSGVIDARGGNASADGGSGGQGGGICKALRMYSAGDVVNSGAILASGGNGLGADAFGGSSCGMLDMVAGERVLNSGALLLDGGDGTGSATNGNGGTVRLLSGNGSTRHTGTTITVASGGGDGVAGENGTILIDGTDMTPIDGTLP